MVMMTREEYYAQIKEMYAQKYESPSMKAWRSGYDHFERSGDDRWFSEEDRRFREYLMSRNDDDDETWTWTEHYSVMDDETDWWYRSEKEDPEDQSLDDGVLVETEVVTELDGIEQQTVNNEENANENLDILEEESITQIQVPVSSLESSLQFHNASSDICDDFKSSLFGHQEAMLQVSHVKKRDELPTKSTDVTNNQAAHYLFDKMPLRMQSKRRHIKCHKSWRFKFKHRVASRESKAGFEVNMKHNQFKEMLLQLLLSGTHKKRQRETPKYHKSWKFRFKKMDMKFQEVIVDDVLSVMVCLCVPNKKFEAGLEIYGCETKKQMLLLMKLANRVWECGELLATHVYHKWLEFCYKHKWRSKLSHSFSEMKQRVLVSVRKSFGYLMEAHGSKYKGLGCVVVKKKLRNVEDGVKQDKNRFSGDVGAKVFMAAEELHLLQDVFELVKELPLKTSLVSPQVMRNTKRKFTKLWMFKFKKKKVDQWLGYNLIVAYLRNKKTWAKLRVRELDNLTWEEDASDESWNRSRIKPGEAMITYKHLLEKSYDKNVEIVAWSRSPGRSEISCEVDAFGDQESTKFRKFVVAFMDISTVAKTQGLGFVHVLHKDAVLDSKLGYLMGNMMEEDQKQQGDSELLVIVLECVDAKGGVGMDKKPSHLSLRNNRVWDPGG